MSAIKTFVTCPKQYAFRYIHHAPAAFRSVALAFGTAWHRTVGEYFLSGDAPIAVGELHDLFAATLEGELDADGPPVLLEDDETVDDLVSAGKRMLDVFVARVPVPEKVLGVEVPFSLELVDPRTGEVLPVPLVGALDAVVLHAGRGAVLELKTGKKKWAADQLETDVQMTAYSLAARALGYDGATLTLMVATKTKAPDVQIEHLVRTRRDEDEFVATALSVHRAVRAGVDHAIRGWQCKNCAYSDVCR
ncbi:MAG: PD-(D/E)XK nuclease family protein [Polyangiaceae bacterium]